MKIFGVFMEESILRHEVEGTRLSQPYSNITTGPAPIKKMSLETANEYDVFINVAEKEQYSFPNIENRSNAEYHWFPIDETMVWDKESIRKSIRVLDFYYDKEKKVYLHCREGRNRSPSITMIWLMSRKHDLEVAALIVAGGNKNLANNFQNNFRRNLMNGFISRN